MTARSVNSLRVSPSGTNGRNSPGGAVELHGRSLKESLPRPNQIGCVRDYAARKAGGEANLGHGGSGWYPVQAEVGQELTGR
jgi:hypothetical protein